jgi:putative transposase
VRTSRFGEEPILRVLQEQAAGGATAAVCRRQGSSAWTFCRWRSTDGGMEVAEAKRLKALEDENGRLKRLVAEQALAWGRRIRLPAVVDAVTRDALAIAVAPALPGERVVRVPEQPATARGVPTAIVLDDGPESTGRALDHWASGRGVQRRFTRPGKPVGNAVAERFVGRLRDACRNEHRFTSLADPPHRRGVAPGFQRGPTPRRPGLPDANRLTEARLARTTRTTTLPIPARLSH